MGNPYLQKALEKYYKYSQWLDSERVVELHKRIDHGNRLAGSLASNFILAHSKKGTKPDEYNRMNPWAESGANSNTQDEIYEIQKRHEEHKRLKYG